MSSPVSASTASNKQEPEPEAETEEGHLDLNQSSESSLQGKMSSPESASTVSNKQEPEPVAEIEEDHLDLSSSANDIQEADNWLTSVRVEFIKRVSEPILRALLDGLLDKNVINDEEMEAARGERLRTEKARHIIDMVRKKGHKASSEIIDILRQLDPSLSELLHEYSSTNQTCFREIEGKILEDMEKKKDEKEQEITDRYETELKNSVEKIEGSIQKHEEDIRKIDDKIGELEKQMSEKTDEKKKELEQERREIETDLNMLREKQENEKSERKESYNQEMEQVEEIYTIEKASIAVPEIISYFKNEEAKMQRQLEETNKRLVEKDQQLKQKDEELKKMEKKCVDVGKSTQPERQLDMTPQVREQGRKTPNTSKDMEERKIPKLTQVQQDLTIQVQELTSQRREGKVKTIKEVEKSKIQQQKPTHDQSNQVVRLTLEGKDRELQNENKMEESKRKQLTRDLQDKSNEVENLKATMKEKEKQNTFKVMEGSKREQQLTQSLQDKKKEVVELKEREREQQKAIEKMEESKGKQKMEESKREQEVDTLKTTLDETKRELQNTMEKMAESDKKQQQLTQDLQDKSAEVQNLKDTMKEKEQEDTVKEMEECKREKQHLTQGLQDMKNEVDKLKVTFEEREKTEQQKLNQGLHDKFEKLTVTMEERERRQHIDLCQASLPTQGLQNLEDNVTLEKRERQRQHTVGGENTPEDRNTRVSLEMAGENTPLLTDGQHPKTSRPFRIVSLCLGILCILLLGVIIGLAVHYSNANISKPDPSETCSESDGWEALGYNTHMCYKIPMDEYTWVDARKHCQAEGGDLVFIETQTLMDSLKKRIAAAEPREGRVWVGLISLHLLYDAGRKQCSIYQWVKPGILPQQTTKDPLCETLNRFGVYEVEQCSQGKHQAICEKMLP